MEPMEKGAPMAQSTMGKLAVVLALGALALCPMAAQGAERPARLEWNRVPAGDLAGHAMRSDLKTPVAEAPVKVWNVETGEFAWDGATDEAGAFTVPEMESGEYLLVANNRAVAPLAVAEDAEPLEEAFTVVVPLGQGDFGSMSEEEQVAALRDFYDARLAPRDYAAAQAGPGGVAGGVLGGLGTPGLTGIIVGAGVVGGGIAVRDHVVRERGKPDIISPPF